MDIEYLTVDHLTTKDLIRFFSKVTIHPDLQFNETCCWIWYAGRTKEGYGMFGDSKILAHRFMYAWLCHPLPKGIRYGEMDHLCRRPSCCNPVHLEFVSRHLNMIRSNNNGSKNARKTHCVKGHPFQGSNLYYTSNGARWCRICTRSYQKEYRVRHPERVRQYEQKSRERQKLNSKKPPP